MDFEPLRQHNKLVAANTFTEMVLFQFKISKGQTIMLVAEATPSHTNPQHLHSLLPLYFHCRTLKQLGYCSQSSH